MLAILLKTRTRPILGHDPQVQGHVSAPRGMQADTRALRVRQQRTRHVPSKGICMGAESRTGAAIISGRSTWGMCGSRDRIGPAKKSTGSGTRGPYRKPLRPKQAAGCLWNRHFEEFSRRSASQVPETNDEHWCRGHPTPRPLGPSPSITRYLPDMHGVSIVARYLIAVQRCGLQARKSQSRDHLQRFGLGKSFHPSPRPRAHFAFPPAERFRPGVLGAERGRRTGDSFSSDAKSQLFSQSITYKHTPMPS